MSPMPLARRTPSWVPTVMTSMIRQRLEMNLAARALGLGFSQASRSMPSLQMSASKALRVSLHEERANSQAQGQRKDGIRTSSPTTELHPFYPSSTKFPHRQSSVHAGVANVDRVNLTDKAGDNFTASPRLTLRELCDGMVPKSLLEKAEEIGFKYPTQAQQEALPVLLSGTDCLLHAQTGSGKTLAYLLPIVSKLLPRSAVQAVIVVPTRELGMQVAKVARNLMGKSSKSGETQGEEKGALSVMTLLDGGTASRQKKWIKAAPPQLIVGTLKCLSRLIESQHLKTSTVSFVVIDEVDSMLGAAKEMALLRDFLTAHTKAGQRQTVFVSATIPQHNHFMKTCIQNKWAKGDLVHIHVSPEVMMPEYLRHRYVVCEKGDKLQALVTVLNRDSPQGAIIFVNESEKAKRSGEKSNTSTTAEFLSEMLRQGVLGEGDERDHWEPLVLEEEDHINQRTSTLEDFRGGRCLLVATDLAARGLDLPEVSHVYNIDMPPNLNSYIHRAGRTGRKPIEEEPGTVTSFIIQKELFVLQRIENESHSKFVTLDL